MADVPSWLVFGSLAPWPAAEELGRLHATLSKHQPLRATLGALQSLPDLWDTLVARDPSLSRLPGRESAERLSQWALTEKGIDLPSGDDGAGNQLTMPMTVLQHFCQYFDYVEQDCLDGAHEDWHGTILARAAEAGGGIQGLCVGLLSALAIGSSTDLQRVALNGALSLRLAFAIGTYVDLDLVQSGPTNALAIRWPSKVTLEGIEHVLVPQQQHLNGHMLTWGYPVQAYVSVVRDIHDATISAPMPSLRALSQELSGMGITVLNTGLSGRYHNPVHEGVVGKVLEACELHGSIDFGQAHATVDADVEPHAVVDSSSVTATAGTASSSSSGSTGASTTLDAVHSILALRSEWYGLVSSSMERPAQDVDHPAVVVSFGIDAVPPSLARAGSIKVVKASRVAKSHFICDRYPEDAVAVIGMSCKLPGADSPDEFWQLLTEGRSMVEPVPSSRWPSSASTRRGGGNAKNPNSTKFWGNFMRDIDVFDHRFFGKSSREAASMDPQQRLLLQATYEAVESSGYFANPSSRPKDIGCYLGLCATDYDSNVASHPPNAFSTLGTLRAFLSGKLSHFFGWTGPSLTFDTACSSSAVAIHTACQALRNGECSQAIAGGIALFTSPFLYENLAAAHFLSPTGASKPFDARADGYCRGEGLGLVVLKKLSAALADDDHILAVIAGSAVNQNHNCVPIMVPHSSSQDHLYRQVARQAAISPSDVSFVEAHGTGTPVGDPIEMESIRSVFGGPQRRETLYVSSVKGAIGHLEGASGVAGLIKTILQLEKRMACVQASFRSLNPTIPSLSPSRIEIPTVNTELPRGFLSACVNNYGAAGSNASMIVLQAPQRSGSRPRPLAAHHAGDIQDRVDTIDDQDKPRWPIRIMANSKDSVLSYCNALSKALQSSSDVSLPSIAFQLSQRQNQGLPFSFTTTAADLKTLRIQLAEQTSRPDAIQERPKARRPLVLVFGGQVSNRVALDRRLWQQSILLRHHLDRCDAALRALRYPSLYPGIFQAEPVADTVALHSMVFAMQYASAQAWIDSGLAVDALVGHSLGQLTALCVAGTLSLEDGLKLVCGRAALIQKHWGSEAGAMVAVEADIETISSFPHTLEVACYNGLTSHVLVGDSAAVDAFVQSATEKSIRCKRLNVTHGFHSKFTEPLLPSLEKLAAGLTFHAPKMRLETCSDVQSWPHPITADLVAQHTRSPVFFAQAVQRVADSLGACTWLEAGSDSSVAGMVRRALDPAVVGQHGFQPIYLNKANSPDAVVEATVKLWNWGHALRFWNFHRLQRHDYTFTRLPSYHFEKNRHWLEIVPPATAPSPVAHAADASAGGPGPKPPPTLVTLTDKNTVDASFQVDLSDKGYRHLVSGHVVAGSALCPATMYIEMAVRAASKLLASEKDSSITTPLLSVQNLQIESPLGLVSPGRQVLLKLRSLPASGDSDRAWNFEVSSRHSPECRNTAGQQQPQQHCSGQVHLQRQASSLATVEAELQRYERLVSPTKMDALYEDLDGESIRGATVYRMFARVVEYAKCYRGVKSIASRDGQIAGAVTLPPTSSGDDGDALLDMVTQPPLLDSFLQVAGLHANTMTLCDEAGDVFVFTALDRMQLGPGFSWTRQQQQQRGATNQQQGWKIFVTMTPSQPQAAKQLAHDLFVYDAESGRLVVLLLGARFTRVKLTSLSKVLSRVNGSGTAESGRAERVSLEPGSSGGSKQRTPSPQVALRVGHGLAALPAPSDAMAPGHSTRTSSGSDGSSAILSEIRDLVERVAEVPRDQVRGDVSLADLGIDSLMLMELFGEVSDHFNVHLPVSELESMADVNALVRYLVQQGCGGVSKQQQVSSPPSSQSDDLASDEDTFSSSTPATSTVAVPLTPRDNLGATPAGLRDQVSGKLSALVQEHLELPSPPLLGANLADLGLDSLLCIELANDIENLFSVSIDMYQLNETSTYQDLLQLVDPQMGSDSSSAPEALDRPISPRGSGAVSSRNQDNYTDPSPHAQELPGSLAKAQAIFEAARLDFDKSCAQQKFTGFWANVYPDQARLVESYIGQAFKQLGIDLSSIREGQRVPELQVLAKHHHLVRQLHHILTDGGYVEPVAGGSFFLRTARPFDLPPPEVLLDEMLQKHPLHAAEHRLLNVTGSRLAACLTGQVDPLQLLFANKTNRQLLADVYDYAPMCQAATHHLATFLGQVLAQAKRQDGTTRTFHLLEVGAGTGGTTRFLVDYLSQQTGIKFTYTFTDISAALVSQAKKKFAAYGDCMRYVALDCEKTPSAGSELLGAYDVVISTNCVHATSNAATTLRNLKAMLRPDGLLALVEFTRGLYWFDLVYGLLDGWWVFGDGRRHALGDERFWAASLRHAGFEGMGWTDGETEEARTIRLICGFNAKPTAEGSSTPTCVPTLRTPEPQTERRAGVRTETVVWKQCEEGLGLSADIYYPSNEQVQSVKDGRPVALLLHGGGYVACTRRDIPMKHIKLLLRRGFLPVSVDYRLCPEVTFLEGPVADALDALAWVRQHLPSRLEQYGLRIDGARVAVVGWSVGGHIAMALPYMARAQGLVPPETVLSFYAPSNLEDPWWKHPIYPKCIPEPPDEDLANLDLLAGVRDEPLPGYQPAVNRGVPGVLMSLHDERWRIVIHMNWNAQLVHILVHGLPSREKADRDGGRTNWKRLPWPATEAVQAISPYAQIVRGNYRTPTFVVHGERDDLIPCQQSRDTIAALRAQGVEAHVAVVSGVGHGFDLDPAEDRQGKGWAAMEDAYSFLSRQIPVAGAGL